MTPALTPMVRSQHEERIRKACPVLHPTGCTLQFCQSGRMSRPLEPKVGENRPIEDIKREARAFLYEMYEEGLFANQDVFESRLGEVLAEIDSGIINSKVWVDNQDTGEDGVVELKRVQVDGVSSRGWVQNREELEWGVKVAWRNARKCIMRAHFQDLMTIDLRHVATSKGMIDSIIERTSEAYNNGRIQPTVFVFPARSINEMGPMFWSPQLLTFAGYKLPNGKILGDPASVQITEDIMNLGWSPPEPKSRWDILPIVAMAEGDEPAWGILPPELTEPICIRHPGYGATFDALDLKWCRFPALSKLGFDIGGVQYTASPFIGWFMDAEIAVRDLADTFRYNVLPEVIKAIGWKKTDLEFEDLPDHEKLLWMSRAQAELNYAVHYSFMNEGVTSTSSLTASESWCAFDDQHLQEKGYRLNADPYWIAPPQGSIVPLWHRGGAPNYQPKPLIAGHHYDPVKLWKERRGKFPAASAKSKLDSESSAKTLVGSLAEDKTRVHILWSGTGGTSLKLAERLRNRIHHRLKPTTLCHFGSLNSASSSMFHADDVVLFVISTTGQGQMPLNGQKFVEKLQILRKNPIPGLRYAIFGLGDSGYYKTFNAAAISIGSFLDDIGATPLSTVGVLKSDVALENPPLGAFKSWYEIVDSSLEEESSLGVNGIEAEDVTYLQQLTMIDSCQKSTATFENQHHVPGHIMKLSLEISEEYQEMSHIRLVPRNSAESVGRVMSLLGITDDDLNSTICLPLTTGTKMVKIKDFLTDYVEIQQPFRKLEWMATCPFLSDSGTMFQNLGVICTLERLFSTPHHTPLSPQGVSEILLAMQPFRPRCYSIASSPSPSTNGTETHTADILMRILPNGRFSSRTIASLSSTCKIRYKLDKVSSNAPLLQTSAPTVAVACGTGFGPVRSLVQLRISQSLACSCSQAGKLTLFLGFKPHDGVIFTETVNEANEHGILDAAYLLPSNEEKKRVQDLFLGEKAMLRRLLEEMGGWLYVCGSEGMVKDVKDRLADVLGRDIWVELLERGRVIEEVF